MPTGEEDEDVLKDVRGVRLYIKRGDSAISSGIVGQVKLLSTRNEEKPKKRLCMLPKKCGALPVADTA